MKFAHRSAVVALSVVLTLLATMLTTGTPAAVAASPPPLATPNDALDSLWNDYGDQGGHWTGGDRTVSVELPDGRTAWLFSDTFLGDVNTDRSRPSDAPLVNNTLVVEEDGLLGPTLHGGTAEQPTALVTPPEEEIKLWVADGTVESGQLKVLYTQIEQTGGSALDLQMRGTSLATFSLPELELTGLTSLPLGDSIAWGQEIIHSEGYTYVYGSEDEGGLAKYLHVARVPEGNIEGDWEFWTGSSWSSDQSQSKRLLTGIGQAFSVAQVADQFVLVTMDTNITFNSTVVVYTASSPVGEFGDPRAVFDAPETEGTDKPIFVYDTAIHPQLSTSDNLVVSYNVNSLEHTDNVEDVSIYRPRFIDVSWPLPERAPDGSPESPVNVSAVDQNDGTVQLSWDSVDGTDISYRIYQRNLSEDQKYFTRYSDSFDSTNVDLSLLRADHHYEFRIAAENSVGEGALSTTVGVTIEVTAPESPTNVRANPNTSGEIELEWDASPSSGHITYRVERRDVTANSDEFVPLGFPEPIKTTITDKELAHNHRYEYRVFATRSGLDSAPSNLVQATATYEVPDAPANLQATPTSDGKIEITWDAHEEDVWYLVYQRDVTEDSTTEFRQWEIPVTTNSVTAEYLRHEHTYEFAISATNRGGEGPKSSTVQATAEVAPPAAPTNLTATPNGDGTIQLDWDAPDKDSWHWVYRRDVTAGDTNFTRGKYPFSEGSSATADFLKDGHVYEFKVSATNLGGEGPFSNVARAKAEVAPPPKPTELSTSRMPNGDIKLSWTAPDSGLDYYVYDRDVTAGESEFTKWEYPVTSGTEATATYLTHNHKYEFKVVSVYAGKESAYAGPVVATSFVEAPDSAPTGLEIVARNDGSAQLSWFETAPDDWYYIYQRDVTEGESFKKHSYPTSKTQFVAKPLIDGHTYAFKVQATNAGGDGPVSGSVQVVAKGGTPVAPNLSGNAGDNRATLNWDAVSGADLYVIYRRNVSAGDDGYTKLEYPTESTSFTDTFLTNGDVYEYRVAGTNEHGEGGWSNAVRVKPVPPKPPAPAWLSADAGNGKVTLNWGSVPNAWYVVEVRDKTAGQTSFRRIERYSSSTTWTDMYLTNGHVYEYRVRAMNLAGDGPATGVESARPMPPKPSAPSGISANAGNAKVALKWTASSTPYVGYVVERRRKGTSSWVRLAAGCCKHTSLYLTNGVTYEFRVRARNISGDSPATKIVTARPLPPPPESPSIWVEPFAGHVAVSVISPCGYYCTYRAQYRFTDRPEMGWWNLGRMQDGTQKFNTDWLGSFKNIDFRVVADNGFFSTNSNTYTQVVLPTFSGAYRLFTQSWTSSRALFWQVRNNVDSYGDYWRFDWTHDGCSAPVGGNGPDGVFLEPCVRHDFGYRNHGPKNGVGQSSPETRKRVDRAFLIDMDDACNDWDHDCHSAAFVFYAAVREFGWMSWPN